MSPGVYLSTEVLRSFLPGLVVEARRQNTTSEGARAPHRDRKLPGGGDRIAFRTRLMSAVYVPPPSPQQDGEGLGRKLWAQSPETWCFCLTRRVPWGKPPLLSGLQCLCFLLSGHWTFVIEYKAHGADESHRTTTDCRLRRQTEASDLGAWTQGGWARRP